jgi:hypothetical protein
MAGKCIPKKMTFGDWVQDNDQWLVPAMKIAGAASTLIPGVGPIAAAGITAGANALAGATSGYGASADAKDNIYAQRIEAKKQAFNQSLMKSGGFINYTGQDHSGPIGGIPIDQMGNPSVITGAPTVALTEDGEVATTVDGKPYVFSKKLGTADKAKEIQKKYKKRIESNDIISAETMNRELRKLVAENEANKPKDNTNKLFNGGPLENLNLEEAYQAWVGSGAGSANDYTSYDPAKDALGSIAAQGTIAAGANALGAALFKKPEDIRYTPVTAPKVDFSNERLIAEQNAVQAKRAAINRATAGGGSTEAAKAQANLASAAINTGLGQQLGTSIQREETLNKDRLYDAATRNASMKTQTDLYNTRMLQDFREKQMGYLESGVGAIQGAATDYNSARRMGDLLNIEAGRSGYRVVIDPVTGEKKLVPVEGFWENKSTLPE